MNKINSKILVLALMVIIALSLTGCIQGSVNLELNDDTSGTFEVTMAFPDGMDSDTSYTEFDINQDPEASKGITIREEEITYEDGDVSYIGNKATVTFDNFDNMINYLDIDTMTVSEVDNNTVRMTFNMVQDSEDEDEESSGESEYMLQMVAMAGGKIELNVKPNFKILKHNADKVNDGVYTWNILNSAKDKPFIEYNKQTPKKDNPATGVIDRKELEKQMELDVKDIDFHGKALEKLGLLKGDGTGLALDRQLTRAEGAVLFARVTGLDKEVNKFKQDNPNYKSGFTDVPNWAADTINMLHHKKLVAGVSTTKFDSNSPMLETHYATFMLRALDIDSGYSWDTADAYLKDNGYYDSDNISYNEVLNGTFNRRGASYITYNLLFAENKTTGNKLIEGIVK